MIHKLNKITKTDFEKFKQFEQAQYLSDLSVVESEVSGNYLYERQGKIGWTGSEGVTK